MRLRILLGAALVMVFSGCANQWQPYVGAQQDWPTAPGTFAKTQSGIVIFSGFPPKPYDVLGEMVTVGGSGTSASQLANPAVSKAKRLGAPAVIEMEKAREYAGTFAQGGFSGFGQSYGAATIQGYPATNSATVNAWQNQSLQGSQWGMSAPIYNQIRRYWVIRWRE